MASDNEDELLRYYERELTYLRRMGGIFSEKHPKIAGRLELGTDHCPDPTIERMIEAFAFLTGRLQHNIDSQFPEISAALLGILYPHFLDPVPSMSIAKMAPDPEQIKLTTGHTIKKNTGLHTQSHQGELCRFRTCYPVTLWPVEAVYAGFESTDQFDFLDSASNVATVLRITIQSTEGSFAESNLSDLTFYLNGEGTLPLQLYELLFGNVLDAVILPDQPGGRPHYLPKTALTPVGFGKEDDVLPFHQHSHPGYRLLQEYFTFQEKFLFFNIANLDLHSSDQKFDLLFLMDQRPRGNVVVDRNNFLLGCTPIINLFRKTTEPIRWDQRQTEYRLIPDMRRERVTEIHSIDKVTSTSGPSLDTKTFEPFYSFNHHMEDVEHKAFWRARRALTGKKNMPGTEMFLTFLDLDFNPTHPPTEAIYAQTLCTNRDLAEQLPDGAVMAIEEAAPIAKIVCLKKPTRQLTPTMAGAAQWKLISHLSLNYLSMSDGKDSLKALQEILGLYSFANRKSTQQQIMGLRDLSCRRAVRRVGSEAWRGFCRGFEVELEFDENLYAGNSAFMLASVLNHFFPLYASINTFTQLVVKSRQREGIWKKWPPRVGEQIVL